MLVIGLIAQTINWTGRIRTIRNVVETVVTTNGLGHVFVLDPLPVYHCLVSYGTSLVGDTDHQGLSTSGPSDMTYTVLL